MGVSSSTEVSKLAILSLLPSEKLRHSQPRDLWWGLWKDRPRTALAMWLPSVIVGDRARVIFRNSYESDLANVRSLWKLAKALWARQIAKHGIPFIYLRVICEALWWRLTSSWNLPKYWSFMCGRRCRIPLRFECNLIFSRYSNFSETSDLKRVGKLHCPKARIAVISRESGKTSVWVLFLGYARLMICRTGTGTL